MSLIILYISLLGFSQMTAQKGPKHVENTTTTTSSTGKTCLKRNLKGPENFSAKASFRLIKVHCLKWNLKGPEYFSAKSRCTTTTTTNNNNMKSNYKRILLNESQ
jgi:hypothetical protein